MKLQNRELFLRWLAKDQPKVFARVRGIIPENGLGSLRGWETIVNAVLEVGSEYYKTQQAGKTADAAKKNQAAQTAQLQAQLLAVNLQRAQAGLAPIDAAGNVLGAAQLPATGVYPAGTAAAQSRAAIPRGSSTFIPGIPNVVTYVGAGALVLVLLKLTKVL